MKTRLLLGLFVGSFFASMQSGCSTFTTNFHAVEKERVYRSAQLGSWNLERAIKNYNIKTVVNLRGVRDDEWHKKEEELCERLGVKYIDIKFGSSPGKERILKLIDVFENELYPVYMHCWGGRDRAGMASAVYLVYNKNTIDEAMEQLTAWKYRNFLPVNRKKQRDFFELYADFCGKNGKTDFKDWLTNYYGKKEVEIAKIEEEKKEEVVSEEKEKEAVVEEAKEEGELAEKKEMEVAGKKEETKEERKEEELKIPFPIAIIAP